MLDLKTNLQEILQEKQEKIIPENIKKDVQIFDVVGTLEGGTTASGVKLFETEEEMQADNTAQEGDLAVVYREEIQNMTADTETQYITFPETVVLPEAFTGDVYCMLRAVDESVMFDGQVMLGQSGFNFNGYSETGMIRVNYQSEDGVTYTRQEFMGDSGDLTNPVDLGTTIHCEMSEEWNDMLGYFMQTGGNVFDGLYEYGKYAVDGYISIPLINDDYTITSTPSKNVTINNSYNNSFNKQDLINICKEIEASVSSNTSNSVSLFMKDNKLYALGYIRTYKGTTYLNSLYNEIGEDNTILSNVLVDGGGTSSGTEGEPNFEVKIWKIDINNKSYSLDSSIQYEISYIKSMTVADSYSTRVTFAEPFDTMCIKQLYTDVTSPYMWKQVSEDDFDQYGITCNLTYNKSEYQTAPNQYTLTSSNQLLPNISAYGKNGNVTGDGSIYNNLDINKINNNLFWNNTDKLQKSKIELKDISIVDTKVNRLYGFDYTNNPNDDTFITQSKIQKIVQLAGGSSVSFCVILDDVIYVIYYVKSGSYHCLTLSSTFEIIKDNTILGDYSFSYSDIYDKYDNCIYNINDNIIKKYSINDNIVSTLATLTSSYDSNLILAPDETNLYVISYDTGNTKQHIFKISKANGEVLQLRTYSVADNSPVRRSRGLWYSHANTNTAINVVTNETKNITGTLMYSNQTDKYYGFFADSGKNYIRIYDNQVNVLQTIELSTSPQITSSEHISSANNNYICTKSNVIRVSDGLIVEKSTNTVANRFFYNIMDDEAIDELTYGESYYYGKVIKIDEPTNLEYIFLLSNIEYQTIFIYEITDFVKKIDKSHSIFTEEEYNTALDTSEQILGEEEPVNE